MRGLPVHHGAEVIYEVARLDNFHAILLLGLMAVVWLLLPPEE